MVAWFRLCNKVRPCHLCRPPRLASPPHARAANRTRHLVERRVAGRAARPRPHLANPLPRQLQRAPVQGSPVHEDGEQHQTDARQEDGAGPLQWGAEDARWAGYHLSV